MTQTEIAIEMAAECAAYSAIDAFGPDEIPSARVAWDFINEQVYLGEGNMTLERPLHLPENMCNGFNDAYVMHVARLLKEGYGR